VVSILCALEPAPGDRGIAIMQLVLLRLTKKMLARIAYEKATKVRPHFLTYIG